MNRKLCAFVQIVLSTQSRKESGIGFSSPILNLLKGSGKSVYQPFPFWHLYATPFITEWTCIEIMYMTCIWDIPFEFWPSWSSAQSLQEVLGRYMTTYYDCFPLHPIHSSFITIFSWFYSMPHNTSSWQRIIK